MIFFPRHTSKSFFVWHSAVLSVFLFLSCCASVFSQTPSQSPLISRDGGGVKPNLVLTMDDSGSMRFQHMPENTAYVGSYAVSNPVGGNSIAYFPGDTEVLSSFYDGVVAGNPSTGNWRQKFMRSPDTNTIYYNPEVRYQPWYTSTGARKSTFSFTASPFDPMSPSGDKVNLSSVSNSKSDTWCFRSNSSTGCSDASTYFNGAIYFRLLKNAGGQYLDPTNASNYTVFDLNGSTTSFTKYPKRLDCAGSSCTQAEERQNFANWFTYYRSRQLLAKGALAEAFVTASDTYRIGWGRINKASSSIDGRSTGTLEKGVRDLGSSHKTSLYDWIYNVPADGGTPLRTAMRDVGNYFSWSDNRGPWGDNPGNSTSGAHKTCRRSYHIMITDGYWNGGDAGVGNVDNTAGSTISGAGGRSFRYNRERPYRDDTSNSLADTAMYYWVRDLRTDLDNKVVPTADNPAFWQHLTTYTVGLGVRGTLNPATDLAALTSGTKTWGSDQIDDLWHAALNTRGKFFSANDPVELAAAIKASVGEAVERELRESGVSTAATTLETGNRKYVPFYRTGSWVGDVLAYDLDQLGQAGTQLWNAEARLPSWDQRRIFTWNRTGVGAGSGVDFNWASLGSGNRTALGTVAATHTTNFVNYLRGDASNEGVDSAKPFRPRDARLGDFVNSNPVFVRGNLDMGYTSLPSVGSTYPAYLATKRSRTGVLFIGSNDGMLHGFKDSTSGLSDDGKEVFAYVPRAVYPNLEKLLDKQYGTLSLFHQYFVDGNLTEIDAHVPPPGGSTPEWRNFLLGSTGAGARAVFGLDVTDTSSLGANSLRWEYSDLDDADIGYVMAPLASGRLANGEWVALFGNGAYSTSGKAVLFVVNLTSRVLSKLVINNGPNNGLGGVAVRRNSAGDIESLYAGDLLGNLWKLNYDSVASARFSIGNSGQPLFVATAADLITRQPILQAPVLFTHSQGGVMVAFGTGKLLTVTDADSSAMQALYGVWDKPTESLVYPLTRAQLATRTITSFSGAAGSTFYDVTGSGVTWSVQRGWVIDLSVSGMSGLRLNYPAQVMTASKVFFQTVAPAQNVVVCETATGRGVNLIIPVEQGMAVGDRATATGAPRFDTDGNGVFDSSDNQALGFATGADGTDAVVRGQVVNLSGGGSEREVSLQNTTGQVKVRVECEGPDCVPPPEECVPSPGHACTPTSGGARTFSDRTWRRILNPPLR